MAAGDASQSSEQTKLPKRHRTSVHLPDPFILGCYLRAIRRLGNLIAVRVLNPAGGSQHKLRNCIVFVGT
jgi:hypothetical protein